MSSANITLTTRRPEPPKADFAFCIDFKRGETPASRVFSATHAFIRACEQLDHDLVNSIDSSIQTVMVLEDIEAGSLKTYLRSELEAVDDQALKDLAWKKLVGTYLVRAKYAILRWMDEGEKGSKDLVSLGRDIQDIAAETDSRHLPDYIPPRPTTLVKAIQDFQEAKDHLHEGDRAYILTDDDQRYDMNLSMRWDAEDIEALVTSETRTAPPITMTFIVKKPDYLGESQWELRHGTRSILAKIEDREWLNAFQNRRVNIRPGDALKCQVRMEMSYGIDNELISEHFYIEKVDDVLEDQYQRSLFEDGDA